MTVNRARALSVRLQGIRPDMNIPQSERYAAAILANGAVFKTAEEYEEILVYIDGLSTALSDLVLAAERKAPAVLISELRAARAALDAESSPHRLPDAAELDRLRTLVEMLEKGIPYEQARAALQPEGSAGTAPDRYRDELAARFWVYYRCGYVDCEIVEPHEHGGGPPMREMTPDERAAAEGSARDGG